MIVYHVVGNEWQAGHDLLSSRLLGKPWRWRQPKNWAGTEHDKYVHTMADYKDAEWFINKWGSGQTRVLKIDLPETEGIIQDKGHVMVPDRIQSEWIIDEMPLL